MKNNIFPGILLPLALATTAQASTASTDSDTYKMDEVVVTASRTAQTVDQTLAPVSVVTRQDIENSQATSVPELLNTLPGVQITSNGGPGASTSLSIRGTSSSQSLVLLDGQRIGSATLGTTPIQYLDPDQIERIEVVRGPRASLYGADAIGGVVNIITRGGTEKPQASFKAGYGSRNTRTASANFSSGNEATRYHIGVSRFITDGYDRTHVGHESRGDKDAYHNTTASLKLKHKFNDKLTGGVNLFQSEGVSEYDISAKAHQPRSNFKDQLFSGLLEYSVSDTWKTSLTVSRTADISEAKRTDSPSTITTKRNLASWQNNFAVTDTTLLITGFDYQKDKVDLDNRQKKQQFEKTSRTNRAIFVQTQTNLTNSDFQLAMRRDKNERYGYNTTGNIAWGYNLPENMRLIASYGTAFKAPSFNQLYWPKSGNPNLKPEESKNSELELRGKHSYGHWSVSLFQNKIDEMINWVKNPVTNKFAPTNVDEARVRGIELQTSAKIESWSLSASFTILSPKDLSYKDPKSGQTKEKVLRNRARRLLKVSADYGLGDYSVGGILKVQGHSYSDRANEQRVAGFATIDLHGSWQVNKEVKAGLKLVNLMNRKYQSVKGYREEPRGIFATLSWSPSL